MIAQAAFNKKGEDIVVMDMRGISGICDYFVIASAGSTRRVKTISDGIQRTLAKKGTRFWHAEGEKEALWVLLDYGDVVCHIFYSELRDIYDLEHLWQDAPKERFIEKCLSKKSKMPYRGQSKTL